MITDRRRLRGDAEAALIEREQLAAQAGVHLIQIRERDLDGGPLTRLVSRAVEAVRGTRTRILVNDRVDVAVAAGAHGVHLRGDSMPAARARALLPAGAVVGRSIHAAADAVAATAEGSLDYLLFGHLFDTPSKPGLAPAGLEALAAVVSTTSLPVLAVGGITVERMAEVARTGASGAAAVGLFADSAAERLQVVVRQAALAFDTP
jgi:thiamine-phosphate pyrophosphorylase